MFKWGWLALSGCEHVVFKSLTHAWLYLCEQKDPAQGYLSPSHGVYALALRGRVTLFWSFTVFSSSTLLQMAWRKASSSPMFSSALPCPHVPVLPQQCSHFPKSFGMGVEAEGGGKSKWPIQAFPDSRKCHLLGLGVQKTHGAHHLLQHWSIERGSSRRSKTGGETPQRELVEQRCLMSSC